MSQLLRSVVILTNPRGAHDSAQLYAKMDEVQHQTSVYVASEDIPAGVAITDERWICKIDNSAAYQAELARASAESARSGAESGRSTAETGRGSAETGRSSAEGVRATTEIARAGAEAARGSAETGRLSAESARASAESARGSAEAIRQTQETSRQNAEAARNVFQAWSASTEYVAGNKVADSGSSYLCVAPHTNQQPPNATYWLLIAAKGDATAALVPVVDAGTYFTTDNVEAALQQVGAQLADHANLIINRLGGLSFVVNSSDNGLDIIYTY